MHEKRMPSPQKFANKEDPPELMKGRFKPLVGMIPRTTLILSKACIPTSETIETVVRYDNFVDALAPILNPITIKNAKRETVETTPKNPNSSPTTLKIKSLWASGR